MTIMDWVQESLSDYRQYGPVTGTRHIAKGTFHSILGRIDPHISGWNIYDEEWDLLIIIDACRADLFTEILPRYDWLSNKIETRRSVGPATRNWMRRTFIDEHAEKMAATDYVVANPYSEVLLDPTSFGLLDEVHRYAWDEEYGTVQARPVTERAIDIHRTRNPDRLLVHYLPPHFPSIPDHLGYDLQRDEFSNSEGTGVKWDSVWDAARVGEISIERIWKAYRANLEYVIDDIAILLENVDADRAILSSDHGNAIGEWWTYGHPPGMYVPVNRRIPYIEVTATDNETLEPTLKQKKNRDMSDADSNFNSTVDDRLSALGYT